MLLAAVLATGCGSEEPSGRELTRTQATVITTVSEQPTDPEPETQPRTETQPTNTSGGYVDLYANTYNVARELCEHFGVEAVAKEYGSAAEPFAAAEAYSTGSIEGTHRQAAFEGCYEGFRRRG